jgi:hypothetical protein
MFTGMIRLTAAIAGATALVGTPVVLAASDGLGPRAVQRRFAELQRLHGQPRRRQHVQGERHVEDPVPRRRQR